jgi:hypothetical protein
MITKNGLTLVILAVGVGWALWHSFVITAFLMPGKVWVALILTLIAVVAVQLRWPGRKLR